VITSSLLTLVVVPVTYCLMDDLAQWFKRKFTRQAQAAGRPSGTGAVPANPASLPGPL